MQYPWHPLFGAKLSLVKTAKQAAVELHCETIGGIVLSITRWMRTPGAAFRWKSETRSSGWTPWPNCVRCWMV